MNRPLPPSYPAWAEKYISLVGSNVMQEIEDQVSGFPNFLNNWIEKIDFAYAPGKWTIRQLASHMLDTERVLMYRLVCIARGDKQPLPGFEEDSYVDNTLFDKRSLFEIGEEFRHLRRANWMFIKALKEEELDRSGVANNLSISARALVFVLVGHVLHHQNIIKERYI